jgi:peptidyl-prolyl cis-trans isomerase A (cyclophilin A)
MRLSHAAAAATLVLFAALAVSGSIAEEGIKSMSWKSEAGTYAVMDTSEGTIVARLFEKEAQKTVENFIGLAEGTKEFKDPVAGVQARRAYYDGTVFHRIIPGFMMQGGDPTGSGTAGPGYTIPDEFGGSAKFDVKGRLAMANVGRPNTGGSQFFITTAATTWLNGKHTIFGQVVEGQDVVDRVCGELGSKNGQPKKTVTLKKVTIERVGASK